jgi:hypothetical protein
MWRLLPNVEILTGGIPPDVLGTMPRLFNANALKFGGKDLTVIPPHQTTLVVTGILTDVPNR